VRNMRARVAFGREGLLARTCTPVCITCTIAVIRGCDTAARVAEAAASTLAGCRSKLLRDLPQPTDVAQAADLERVGKMFLGLGLHRLPSPYQLSVNVLKRECIRE
jgi:hypothetical protein